MFKKSNNPYKNSTVTALKDKVMRLKNCGANVSETSHCISASHNWVATPVGNGDVAVVATNFDNYVKNDCPPMITAHGGGVQDLKFSPHNPNVLATGGGDGLVKIWQIPSSGITSPMSSAVLSVSTKSSARALAYHPSAAQVLAVSTKDGIQTMDLEKGVVSANLSIGGGFGKDLLCAGWSYDGSMLAAANKKSKLFVLDPRAAAADAVSSGGVDLSKTIRRIHHTFFLDREQNGGGSLGVFALNKMHKPVFSLYDARNLANPVFSQQTDFSTGFAMPLFDPDTNMLYITMRGSGMVQVYDMKDASKSSELKKLNQYTLNAEFKGVSLIPKSACYLEKSEIQRLMALTSGTIMPFSVCVTKKERGFHSDLYPMTFDCAASMAGSAYFDGENKPPALVGVERLANTLNKGGAEEAKEESKADAPAATVNVKKGPTPEEVAAEKKKKEKQEADRKEAEKKAALAKIKLQGETSEKSKAIASALKSDPYRHIIGKEPEQSSHKKSTYFKLQPPAYNVASSRNLCANSKFFALPWNTSGGGAVYVCPLDRLGPAAEGKNPKVSGHKSQITSFDLSMLQPDLLATGSLEADAMVWKIPAKGLEKDMTEPAYKLRTNGKISCLRFSPYVSNLLAACSTGFDGSHIRLWDVEAEKAGWINKDWHGDQIMSVDFCETSQLIATASKDKKTRIIDPRANKVVAEFQSKEHVRDVSVFFTSASNVLTVGTGARSQRGISLWNFETQTQLAYEEYGQDTACVIPHFDYNTGLLWCASNGSANISGFRVAGNKLETLASTKTQGDVRGHAFLHMDSVNVREVEVAKSLKLSGNKILPISWTLPRKRLTFFQDDLFPSIIANTPVMDAKQWFSNSDPNGTAPQRVSLRPANMTNLSEAPAEELTERQKRYLAHVNKEAAPAPKGILGHTTQEEVADHFRAIAKQLPSRNRFDAAQESADDVDSDEWGSD